MEKIVIYSMIILYVPCVLALSGSGNQQDPYHITSLEDFDEFIENFQYWDDYIRLECILDLDPNLSGRVSYTTALIAPDTISETAEHQGPRFTGVFDGNGFTIRNLTIHTEGQENDFLGLFGMIEGIDAEVKNLTLENVRITGGDFSYWIGGLCGYNVLGTIRNCQVTGIFKSGTNAYYLGAFCGRNDLGYIDQCRMSGTVQCKSYSYYIGGLCGDNDRGTISNCSVAVDVTCRESSRHIGGICGQDSGMLVACYTKGKVSSGDSSFNIGGLCGRNYGTISNCYSYGTVQCGETSFNIGGLCGINYSGTVKYSMAAGLCIADSTSNYIGGFCGYHYGSLAVMKNCFWDTSVSQTITGYYQDPSYPGSISNVLGKTTNQLQSKTTFTQVGWDFVDETNNGWLGYWVMPETGYPIFWWKVSVFNEDTNLDRIVNVSDLNRFCREWLLTEPDLSFYLMKCDFNEDRFVNLKDFAHHSRYWLISN